jgi:hypothetical protein
MPSLEQLLREAVRLGPPPLPLTKLAIGLEAAELYGG